jgi:hypothetical protein
VVVVVRAPHLVDCASVIGMTHELGTMVDGVFSCVSLFSLSLSFWFCCCTVPWTDHVCGPKTIFEYFFFIFQKERNKFRFYTVVVVVVVVVVVLAY